MNGYRPFDRNQAQNLLTRLGAPTYDADRFANGINSAYEVLLSSEADIERYQPSKVREHLKSLSAAVARLSSLVSATRSFSFTVLESAVGDLNRAGSLPRTTQSVPISRIPTAAIDPSEPDVDLEMSIPELSSWLMDLEGRLHVLKLISARAVDRMPPPGRRERNDTPGVEYVRATFYQWLLTEYQRAMTSAGKFNGFKSPPKIEGMFVDCPEVQFLVAVIRRCPFELERIRKGSAARRKNGSVPKAETDAIYQAVAMVYHRLIKPTKVR